MINLSPEHAQIERFVLPESVNRALRRVVLSAVGLNGLLVLILAGFEYRLSQFYRPGVHPPRWETIHWWFFNGPRVTWSDYTVQMMVINTMGIQGILAVVMLASLFALLGYTIFNRSKKKRMESIASMQIDDIDQRLESFHIEHQRILAMSTRDVWLSGDGQSLIVIGGFISVVAMLLGLLFADPNIGPVLVGLSFTFGSFALIGSPFFVRRVYRNKTIKNTYKSLVSYKRNTEDLEGGLSLSITVGDEGDLSMSTMDADGGLSDASDAIVFDEFVETTQHEAQYEETQHK